MIFKKILKTELRLSNQHHQNHQNQICVLSLLFSTSLSLLFSLSMISSLSLTSTFLNSILWFFSWLRQHIWIDKQYDANEKIKSTNNHFIQRRLAVRLIETQAQADRHVLKRRSHIHEISTRLEQKSRQIDETCSDYLNRDSQNQKSENSREIDRIFDFSDFRNETFRIEKRVVCKQTCFLSIRSFRSRFVH